MPGKLCFGLLVLISGLRLCNGQIITITATVADSASGQPLEAAYAELYQYNTKINAASADSLGQFQLIIPAGQLYTLQINYIGYDKVEIPLLCTKDTALYITLHNYLVELSPLEVRGRMAVKITEGCNGCDGYIRSVYLRAVFTGDIIPMINERLAGAYSMRDGMNGEIQFYGSRADATQVIIDGVKVIGDYHIPNSTIKQISVYDMGIPVQYGDVTGGVIEITTKDCNSRY